MKFSVLFVIRKYTHVVNFILKQFFLILSKGEIMKNQLFMEKYYEKILNMDKDNSWKAKLKNHSGFNKTPVGIISILLMIFGFFFGCFLIFEALTTPDSVPLFKAAFVSFGAAVFGFALMKIFGKNIKRNYQKKITDGKLSLAVMVTANEKYLNDNLSLPSAFFYTADNAKRLDIGYYKAMDEKLQKIIKGITKNPEEKSFYKKLKALESKAASGNHILDVPESVSGAEESYIWAGSIINAAPKDYFKNYSNTIIPFLILDKTKETRGWYEKLPVILNSEIWAE
jgi:uncharacterized protein (DUF486 family)